MSIEQALERSHNIIRSALYSGINPEWQNDARDVLIRDKKYLTSSSSRAAGVCAGCHCLPKNKSDKCTMKGCRYYSPPA